MEDLAPAVVQYFKGHTGPITSLSFSPNGKTLASSSEDNSFLVWNLTSNKASLRYKAKPLPVTYVSYSPQGNLIASSQGDYVRIWMASIQGKSIEFKPHLGTVRSVEFSLDGEKLLTASNDKSVKLWMTCRRKFISSFTGHSNWVKLAKYSYDGDMILSCSDDRTTRLWDPNTSKPIHTFSELKGSPRHAAFHPTGTCIGVATSNNATKIYDLRSMKLLQYYTCHSSQVNSLAFHPSGCYMVTASEDGSNKVIDLLEGRVIFSIEAHSKGVTAVEFSKKGDLFATASEDKSVFVWSSNFAVEIEKPEREDGRKFMRESVANNYDPSKPKIQVSTSNLNLNGTHIEDVYSPKDYEETPQKVNRPDKENIKDFKTPCTPLSNYANDTLNKTNGDGGLLSLLDSLTYENEMLKGKVTDLNERVVELENSEALLKRRLFSLEERISRVELHPQNQDENGGNV